MPEVVGARLGFGHSWDLGEDLWKDGVDENFRASDVYHGLTFISDALTAPPGSPADGDTYLVKATATGAWATHDGKIAAYQDSDVGLTWFFYPVVKGLRAYVVNHSAFYYYDGAAWTAEPSGIASLGTVADQRLLANISGSSAIVAPVSLSALLDDILSLTQGHAVIRGASAWEARQLEIGDLADIAAQRLIGNGDTVVGGVGEIVIGPGLTISASGTLSSTATGGALIWQGSWNANTNSPALASGVGTVGHIYTVGTAGTTTIDGHSQWLVGDKIAWNDNLSVWERFEGDATEVTSVAGRVGAVSLAVADVSGAAPLASPTFTGTVTLGALAITGGTLDLSGAALLVPTVTITSNTTLAASTAFVHTYAAPLASPTFTGTVTLGALAITGGTLDLSAAVVKVPTPTLTNSAVTKAYADALVAGLPSINSGYVIGNAGTAAATASGVAVTTLLDTALGSAASGIAVRNGSIWVEGTLGNGIALNTNTLNVHNIGTVTATTTGTISPTGIDSCIVNMGTTNTTLTVGNGYKHQELLLQITQGATAHTVAFDSTVVFTGDITSFTATTTASKSDLVRLIANTTSTWVFAAKNSTF